MAETILDTEKQAALRNFIEESLPAPKAEEYKYTPLARELRKIQEDAGEVNTDMVISPIIEDVTVLRFYNGNLVSSLKTSDKNINITPLKDDKRENTVDPFDRMNEAFYIDGVEIEITGNPDRPILIQNMVGNNDHSPFSIIRNRIKVHQGVEAVIIKESHYGGNNVSFTNNFLQIDLEKSARVTSYILQTSGTNNLVFDSTNIYQQRDSYYKNVTITLEGKMVRNNHSVSIDDVNCESHLFGVYFPGNKNHFDNHTVADHKRERSFSNELYKGILGAGGTAVFNGKIFVRPHAQNTNAFQSNKNILLDNSATLHTKPQLEIWADDVKCSHGCTTGKLDQESLFYLRSRGLDKKGAELILLKAFASDVTREIDIEPLREFVENAIVKKVASQAQ